MLKEKADPLLLDPGKCQLTIQIKREILDDVKNEVPSSDFTAVFESPNKPSRGTGKAPQQGKIGTGEDPSGIDVPQQGKIGTGEDPSGIDVPQQGKIGTGEDPSGIDVPQQGKIGTGEDPSGLDVLQRQTLALATTGTDSAFP